MCREVFPKAPKALCAVLAVAVSVVRATRPEELHHLAPGRSALAQTSEVKLGAVPSTSSDNQSFVSPTCSKNTGGTCGGLFNGCAKTRGDTVCKEDKKCHCKDPNQCAQDGKCVNEAEVEEAEDGCTTNTGGSCHSWTGCAKSRGVGVKCDDGTCHCPEGKCAFDGACFDKNDLPVKGATAEDDLGYECDQNTGSTCRIQSCPAALGPTKCTWGLLFGECMCQKGFCPDPNRMNACTPKDSPLLNNNKKKCKTKSATVCGTFPGSCPADSECRDDTCICNDGFCFDEKSNACQAEEESADEDDLREIGSRSADEDDPEEIGSRRDREDRSSKPPSKKQNEADGDLEERASATKGQIPYPKRIPEARGYQEKVAAEWADISDSSEDPSDQDIVASERAHSGPSVSHRTGEGLKSKGDGRPPERVGTAPDESTSNASSDSDAIVMDESSSASAYEGNPCSNLAEGICKKFKKFGCDWSGKRLRCRHIDAAAKRSAPHREVEPELERISGGATTDDVLNASDLLDSDEERIEKQKLLKDERGLKEAMAREAEKRVEIAVDHAALSTKKEEKSAYEVSPCKNLPQQKCELFEMYGCSWTESYGCRHEREERIDA